MRLIKRLHLISFFLLLCAELSIAQTAEETNFLKQSGYDKFVAADYFGSLFFCRNSSTKKWGVIDIYESGDGGGFGLNTLSESKFDKIDIYLEEYGYRKQYFFYIDGKVGYKTIEYFSFDTTLDDLVFEYDEVIAESSRQKDNFNGEYSNFNLLWVRKGDYWGLNDMWENGNLIPCIYRDRKDVPFQFALHSADAVEDYQKRFKTDLVLILQGDYERTPSGHVYYPEYFGRFLMFRNVKSKLWTVYDIESNDKVSNLEFEKVHYVLLGPSIHGLLAKHKGKWGMMDLENKYVIYDFMYNEKIEVPMVHLTKDQVEYSQMLKKRGIDQVIHDPYNGDGVMKVRNAETGKWGMYQIWSVKEVNEKIPMQYDSLDFFGLNARMTGVWNNGKVGIYLSPWSFAEEDARQTVECLYDDYKIFDVKNKNTPYLSVKQKGRWAWIDWMTGELKTEFLYDLEKEQMPYPEFEQGD
jgi:hypothetical protein